MLVVKQEQGETIFSELHGSSSELGTFATLTCASVRDRSPIRLLSSSHEPHTSDTVAQSQLV